MVLRHSYALFERNIEGNKINFVVGKLNYNFILDEDIEKGIYVKANGYKVVHIELNSTNDIDSKYVFVYKTTENVDVHYIESSDKLTTSPSTDTIKPNETKQIYLAIHNKNKEAVRIDISLRGGLPSNEIEVENEYTKITETATEIYKDSILNGADPVLGEGMIPVTLDDDGTVHYTSLYSEWYNYSSKVWANAIILVNSPSKTYQVGDIIEEKDIQSYFVWIPRYKYKIWNLENYTSAYNLENLTDTKTDSETSLRHITGNARLIDIVFQNKNEKTRDGVEGECETPMKSGETNQCTVDKYMTHPAFINFDANGLWVGKFETGYNQNQNTNDPITTTSGWTMSGAEHDESNSDKVIIKPNVYSWREIKVGNIFNTALNYKQNLGSHMMKNTEWGAVSYLSFSKYGIGNEIRINNNSDYKTGYSAEANTDQNSYTGTSGTDSSTTQPYNTTTGYLASTTGNITGIYDMAGGNHECMASYLEGHGTDLSGLTSEQLQTYTKYFDKYLSNNNETSYNNRILGDATGELGPFYSYYESDGIKYNHNSWFADYSLFVENNRPWFARGGVYFDGILAGQFDFSRGTGDISLLGSRLVLTGKKEITS